jgi:hypothetical protein
MDLVKQFADLIQAQGWMSVQQDLNNYGHPYVYQRGDQQLHCRLVDSVFMDPQAWHDDSVVVTDNIPLRTKNVITVTPEFWHIWRFDPVYEDRPATWAYNCFMNRPRGDRSMVFYELIRKGLLDQGLVSFNVKQEEYEQQFTQLGLGHYTAQHQAGRELVPYNNLPDTLEQCIIDSRVSLIMETYVSDSHLVFSEKLFRCLQMPRPWLLYSSQSAVKTLREHGFDVLDDYVDHSYDDMPVAHARLEQLVRQLETFCDRVYGQTDYDRFHQAAQHNQQRLDALARAWSGRLEQVFEQVRAL